MRPRVICFYTDRAGGLFAVGFDLKTLKITSGAIPIIDDVAPSEFTLSASGSALYSLNVDRGGGGGTGAGLARWEGRTTRFELAGGLRVSGNLTRW